MTASDATRRPLGAVGAFLVATLFTSVVAADRSHLGLFWIGCLAMAASALVLYRRDGLTVRELLVLGITARLMVFWLPPGLSDDAFRYLWDGFVQHAGLNPYSYRPEDLVGWHSTALYGRLNSPSFFTVYPPLSQLLFWMVTPAGIERWLYAWYGWKTLCLLAEMGTLWLVASLSRRALLLYALHPMLIVELVGQAHTEALMVFGLALACWAVAREQVALAGFGLVVAAFTKLYPVLLFPLLLRSRKDVRALVPSAALCLGLTMMYWRPEQVANMLSSLRLYTQYFEFNAGVYYALKEIGWWIFEKDTSKQLGPLLAQVFIASYLCILVGHFVRRRSFASTAVWVFTAYLLFSTTVHPWYVAGLLVVAPFAASRAWSWQYLAAVSMGTYLLYAGASYGAVVWLGWGGALALALLLATRRPNPV